MIRIRRAHERGRVDHGWLDTRHTFSFGGYHDDRFMGYRDLRVINEDRVLPGRGFGRHAHSDMEIVSWVLEGELAHSDSLGSGAVLRPGEIQRMSAGSGIVHSEFNASDSRPVHFLQIWILPAERGIAPSYEQKMFLPEERRGRLCTVVTPGGTGGAVDINQDVTIATGTFARGDSARYALRDGRAAWLQIARGRFDLSGQTLDAGDGAAVTGGEVSFTSLSDGAELLLFDLR